MAEQLIILDEPAIVNYGIYRGTDPLFSLTFLQSVGGAAIDLTGSTITLITRSNDGVPLQSLTFTLTDATAGQCQYRFTIANTSSATVMPARFVYELWLYDALTHHRIVENGAISMLGWV